MKICKLLIAIFVMVTGAAFAQSDDLNNKIQRYLESEIPQASVGMSIRAVNSSKQLVEINADKLLTPASTLKLLTVFTAYEMLGPDFTFETLVGYKGTIKDGILDGDIIVVGGGDPSFFSKRLENRDLHQWVAGLKRAIINKNITCVEGDIILDISRYTGADTPRKWPYEDLGNYYGTGAYALNFNENIVEVFFNHQPKDAAPTRIQKTEPYIPYLTYENYVYTSHKNGRDEAYIFGVENQYNRFISGTIPSQRQGFRIKGSLPHPPTDFGNLLRNEMPEIFPAADVIVTAKSIRNFQVIKKYRSQPFSVLARHALYESINLYCEAFLREIAYHRLKSGSIEDGLEVIYSRYNLTDPNDKLVIYDGSGLTPSNLITPSFLTQVLADYSLKHPDIINLLPEVGKDGTVKRLQVDAAAHDELRLKSGYMDRVLAYAGIYDTSDQKYSITLIVNNSNLTYSQQKRHIEHILNLCLNDLK